MAVAHQRTSCGGDRAVLAVEGRSHDDALAHLPERAAQQRVALVPRAGRCAVEPSEQLLHARGLRLVVGIVGDVQLAAQHPLSHLAHDGVLPRSGAVGRAGATDDAGEAGVAS
jgi:hypothetical protein